ncbi:MAG: class I SAM-dependent methyltransferase [Actinomycetota bacterium]
MVGTATDPPAVSQAKVGERLRLLARCYTADAATYDEHWSPVILPAAESLVRALPLVDARRVLDVGTGTGALARAIRAAAPRAAVVGVDAAEGMLRIARDRRALPGMVGDTSTLPVADASVDVAILAFVLFHLADPLAGLVDVARTLRGGRRTGTVTWAEEHPTRAAQAWEEALDTAGAPLAPERSDHRQLDSPDAVESLLRRSGLIPRRTWTEWIDYTYTKEQFWELRVGFGSPRWRLNRIPPSTRVEVLGQLRDRLETLGPGDLHFRGRVVLAIAEKRE